VTATFFVTGTSKSASGAQFVVAFAQHQDRRTCVFERFLASREQPGRQRTSFWRLFAAWIQTDLPGT
jgi:hypothetical protein